MAPGADEPQSQRLRLDLSLSETVVKPTDGRADIYDKPSLRLAIVNDYPIVVGGLAEMLADAPGVVVAELDCRAQVVSEVDVILFDMFATMPGDGVDLEDLTWAGGAKVVVYTWTDDPAAVARALASGARGYLSKGLDKHGLIEALTTIQAGEILVRPPLDVVVRVPEEQVAGNWPGRTQGLTHREAEVLALIVRGRSNIEIAEALFLSVNTIKTHIRNAYAKIEVTNRSQAVRWALTHGFVPEHGRQMLSSRPPPHADRATRPGASGGTVDGY